jgi:anti-anti-sigma factor
VVDVSGEMVLYPRGEVDVAQAERLRAEWYDRIEERQPERVVVDLADVTFMDSSGLSVVAGIVKLQHQHDGTVALRNASRQVMHIVRLTRLINVVTILDDDRGGDR